MNKIIMEGEPWDECEDEYLRLHCKRMSIADMAARLKRRRMSVACHAEEIGVIASPVRPPKKMDNRSYRRSAVARMHGRRLTPDQMVAALGATREQVDRDMAVLGLAPRRQA